jgi:hypothetical protein
MTAIEPRTGSAPTASTTTLPWLIRHTAAAVWHELPVALVGGLALLLSALPLAVLSAVTAPMWMLCLATLPVAIALTGLAAFGATVAAGERATVRSLTHIDPVLACALAVAADLVGLGLTGGGAAMIAGAVGAAAVAVVAPAALAYGAVRGRRGLAALRGGAILVAFRPSWALTTLAFAVLGGFAVAASAGVLLLIVPGALLAIGAALTARLLAEIDALQARS